MLFGKTKPSSPVPAAAPVVQGPSAAAHDVIFDVTTADFEQRVLMASMERPVIVDFWAPWCGPCKQLGPVLEAAVRAANGAVLMAKVNIDDNQELAAALRVQSIPTVYAFFQGRPIDGFQGALPESQVKAFVDKALQTSRAQQPDALNIPEALKGAATALAASDFMAAQAVYVQILNQDEKNVQAYAGLVRVMIAAGQIDDARQLVQNAPPDIASKPAFAEAKTALELAEVKPSGSFADLEKKITDNPNDHQARYDLASAQFAGGQRAQAIDNLLEIIRKNRGWNEEAARKQLLKFFEAMGHSDPLTIESRRKLSAVLFS